MEWYGFTWFFVCVSFWYGFISEISKINDGRFLHILYVSFWHSFTCDYQKLTKGQFIFSYLLVAVKAVSRPQFDVFRPWENKIILTKIVMFLMMKLVKNRLIKNQIWVYKHGGGGQTWTTVLGKCALICDKLFCKNGFGGDMIYYIL